MPRQIDVIIVLDDRILIVDLKDWGGKISSDAGRWFQNNRSVDTSPVAKILENARVMSTALRGFLGRGAPRGAAVHNPLIEGCVVLTGQCDFTALGEMEKKRVFHIEEFCRIIQDPVQRKARLSRGWSDHNDPYTAPNSKWRDKLGRFFGGTERYFKPLEKRYGDYRLVSDLTYQHPLGIYGEYDVEEVSASQGFGLLRLWDFSKAEPRYASEEGRSAIAGREQNVINYLVDRQPELETVLIRPKIADPEKGVHYWEVFERRRQLRRLREFLASHSEELTTASRIDLARTLLSHVASMHRIGAAHLDIGDHSVWLELPSIIRVSHLVAASYQELASLGDRRYDFLAGGTVLPETIVDQAVDHFRRDVFLLGVAVHTIVFGQPPAVVGEGNPPTWNSAVDTDGSLEHLYPWFARSLDEAAADRFATAQEMLDSFNQVLKDSTNGPNAIEKLQKFRVWKSFLALTIKFPIEELIKEEDRILIWQSSENGSPVLVKAWRSSSWGEESAESPRIAKFCEDAEDFILTHPQGVNRILHVGWLGDHLVLIQDYVPANNLAQDLRDHASAWSNATTAVVFLKRLVQVVSDLHQGGRAHGDLTPTNILVVNGDNGLSPLLIDFLDFGPASEGRIRTPAYSPTNDTGTRERDRFAVLKIAEEIFTCSTLTPTATTWIQDALKTCRETVPVLSTLIPLSDALDRITDPPIDSSRLTFTLTYPGITPGPLTADEGRFYLQRRLSQYVITGEFEEVVIYFNPNLANRVTRVSRGPVKQSQVAWAERRATSKLEVHLTVKNGPEDLSSLLAHIAATTAVESKPKTEMTAGNAAEETSPEGMEFVTLSASAGGTATTPEEDVSVEDEVLSSAPAAMIDVPTLWRTLLSVEEEQITKGTAEANSSFLRSKRRHIVPFQVTTGSIDFARDEEVRVELRIAKSRTWVPIGLLDLDLSRNNQIAVDASRYRASDGTLLCSIGAELRFRSTLEAENRFRRTVATKRILERKSVLPELVDFFNAANNLKAASSPSSTPVEALAALYGLNSSQRKAFTAVCSTKPLGLLQGPPGTGKTKFIAALVHYLLTHGVVRNVLLSSQSNEAVNNATESVLRLFRSGDAEPSLVRVGQEGQISETLKPYHSVKVESHYREQFRAGLKQRFRSAAKHVGLSESFSDDLFFMESTVWPVWKQLQSTQHSDENQEDAGDVESRTSSLRQTLATLQRKILPDRHADVDWQSDDAYDDTMALLITKHAISSAEQVRRLRGVATLARDWTGSVTSRQRSFEEFLANTRQIVAGTCVGLGRSSLGLASARFDLVIIDEAARCTPSELAVPMQAGKWILLVGDHLQLEPFHQPEVIRETQRQLQIPRAEIIKSDFARAFASPYGRQLGQTLAVQYRMLPHIGELVSKTFYKGALEHGRTSSLIPSSALPENLQHELLWISTDQRGANAHQKPASRGKSLLNITEANAIADLLRGLDNHQPFVEWLGTRESDQKAVGIICTYGAQSELIKQKVRAIGLSPALVNAIKIDTVDSYQGKENPIVILSLVRNNEDGPLDGGRKSIAPGFMSRPNRINVALSRAMDRLVIVGSFTRWPKGGTMDEVTSHYRELIAAGHARVIETNADAEPLDIKHKRGITPVNKPKGRSVNAHKR